MSQIRNTRTIYRLSAPDIIDLHEAGVSQKLTEFMINTATTNSGAAAPVPQTQTVYVAQPPPPPLVRNDPPPSQLDPNFGNTPPGNSAKPKDPPPGSGHKKTPLAQGRGVQPAVPP